MTERDLERLIEEAIQHVQDSNDYNPKEQAQLEHAFLGVLVKIRSFDRKVKARGQDSVQDGTIAQARKKAGGA